MGTTKDINDRTCKIHFYLGYGSGVTDMRWISRFHEKTNNKHYECDLDIGSNEYCTVKNGHLYVDDPFGIGNQKEPVVWDFEDFDEVDLS